MKDTTISEIIEQATDEGTWIEAPFDAVVRNAKASKGKAPSSATLHDPQSPGIKCSAAFFGRSALDYEGSIVRFAGKGRQVKSYKGNAEIKIWDKASMTPIGDAPARTAAEAPPADAPSAGARKPAPAAAQRSPEEAANHFHREMKKTALLWLHSYQYARDLSLKILNPPLTPELFQSSVSSLFITAKDRGLLEKPPAIRATDGAGYQTYVAHKPAAPTPEEIEAEAKKRAAEAAAEEERRHKEEQAARAKENLDEDVPF